MQQLQIHISYLCFNLNRLLSIKSVTNFLTTMSLTILNETEQRVLEFLSLHGSSTAGRIAQLIGLKRPTVYATLESLAGIGVVSRHRAAGTTQYQSPEPAAVGKILLQHSERERRATQGQIDGIVTRLQTLRRDAPQEIAGYEIRALDSAAAINIQLEEALLHGNYSAIFNPQAILHGDVEKIVSRFLRESAKSAPPIRELCVDGPKCSWYRGKIRNPNHQVRTLPPGTDISTDMILIDKSVILSHYRPQHELAIRITQHEFFRSMLALFELLWKQSR